MQTSILIVDDDTRNIFALSATLQAKGYRCIPATSVTQALALIRNGGQTDLVLLDMMMPDIDGYEAIPMIKDALPVPVIAVTAQAMVGDREKCIAAGADDYISKPVDVDKLMKVLDTYLK